MNITLENLIGKHTACVNALDENKHCGTCKHKDKNEESEPCNECFSIMLFMPVNPTKWESA